MNKRILAFTALCGLMTGSFSAADAAVTTGGFSLSTTRVIFSPDAQYAGIKLNNTSTHPILAQSRVTAFNELNVSAPFAVTPSVVRIEGGSQREQRIVFLGKDLPQDRETAFTLAVRTATASEKPNQTKSERLAVSVPIALGTNIKLFWRPVNLGMTSAQAMASLKFTTGPSGTLRVVNPSPYNVSVANLKVGKLAIKFDDVEGGAHPHMLFPFSERNYDARVTSGDAVTWQAVSDFGGLMTYKGTVQAKVAAPTPAHRGAE